MTGRTVEVPDRVQRVLLGEGRLAYVLAMLEGAQAFDRVAGWQGDFRGLDTQGYGAFRRRFPMMDDIPVVGGATADTFSTERALALRPDVAFLSVSGSHGPAPGSPAARQLEAAGVPVVFVDFSVHPLRNTLPSVQAMGAVLGRDGRAREFAAFYEAQMARVTSRIGLLASRPDFRPPVVFIDMLAGLLDCCNAPGWAGLGELVRAAGGEGLGADRIPGPVGQLNLEYILARQPDIYVATGVFGAGQGGVTLGYDATPAQARSTLAEVAGRPGIRELAAVREGRAHGMWHVYYDSIEHFSAVQALARWLHPEVFADLDPRASRAEFYARFMPIEATGELFTTMASDGR